jgi:SAM-dependent methyltransferase
MTLIPRYILAPYVPTPPEVVERMIDLAGVQPDDRVYDLGCGDGRLAIAASEIRGARSLGVDVEPYWVERSQLNASAAGVAHLAKFEQGDATSLDLRPATVIFMYLVDWSTQLLARSILQQCAPGTRVVSHSFPFEMGLATRSESFADSEGQPRRIHLWITPGPADSPLPLDSTTA